MPLAEIGIAALWRLVLLAVLIGVALWLALRAGRRAWPQLNAVRARLVRWARPRRDPLSRALLALIDPERPESGGLLLAAALLLGGGWAFFALLDGVLEHDPMVLVDRAVFGLLQSWRVGWLDHAMVAVTEVGSAPVMVPVVLAVAAVLAWRRCWRALGYWLATIAFARVLVWVLKASIGRARPNQALYSGLEQFSFPSGHAASSVVLFGFLAFLLARGRPRAQRGWIAAGGALLIGLVSFSRLYLGAHWLSDVLGSLALGGAWVALVSIVYTLHAGALELPRRALFAAAVGTLLVASALYIGLRHDANMTRYARQPSAPLVELHDWQASGWRSLPARRIDLEREPQEPLALQWAAPAEVVTRTLEAAGWRRAPTLESDALLAMLRPSTSIAELPLVPEFHDAALPALHFVHVAASDQQRLVLRLWPSGYRVALSDNGGPATVPLWLGSVREQSLRRAFAGRLNWAQAQPAAAAPPLDALRRTFAPPQATAPQIEPVPGRPLWLLN